MPLRCLVFCSQPGCDDYARFSQSRSPLDFSRAISSSRSSRSRSLKAVAAPASARFRHSVSLAMETFVCRASEVTYYRWRQEYGELKADQVKRLKELAHKLPRSPKS
jgi:hypothetical protein